MRTQRKADGSRATGAAPGFRVLRREASTTRPETVRPRSEGRPSWAAAGAEALSEVLAAAESGSVQRVLAELQGTAGNLAVQRLMAADASSGVAPRLQRAVGSGRPLAAAVVQRVQPLVGADLSGVRVHDDEESHHLATSLGAEAFTTGQDMFFARGAYDPGSDRGVRTIAHEAAHVEQQARGPVSGTAVADGLEVSDPDDTFERHADEVADRVGTPDAQAPASPASAGSGRPTAQRKCGCGGTCGPCAGGEEKDGGEGQASVQRLTAAPSNSTGPLLVQRKAAPSPVKTTFRTDAALRSAGPNGLDDKRSSGFDPSATLTPVNKGEVPSTLQFDIDISWTPTPKQVGGGPLDCDPCKALDGIPIPDRYKKECNEDNCTFKERKDFVKKLIPDLLEHPCKLLPTSSAETACQVAGDGVLGILKAIPIIGTIVEGAEKLADAIQKLASPLGKALDALDGLSTKLCKDKKFCEDSDAPEGTGEAKVKSTTMFQLKKQGDDDVLVPTGPLPSAKSDGKGAQLAVPVQIARESIERGARINLAPAMVTTGGGTEAHLDQRSFFVNVMLQPKPPAREVLCPQVSGPFNVAKTTYMKPPKGPGEDGEREKLFNWYFSLQPTVREEIEEGRALVKLTGRCSTTGSKTFNLDLAKRRAEKVRDIIANFTGNNSRMRFFAVGEFVSGEDNKEDASQRRVDIEVSGSVPGERVEGVGDLCSGGFGQPTKGGANTEPKVESVESTDGAGPAAVVPQAEEVPAENGFQPVGSGGGGDFETGDGGGNVVNLEEETLPDATSDQSETLPVEEEEGDSGFPDLAGIASGFSDFFLE